jgi:hypothetical protein
MAANIVAGGLSSAARGGSFTDGFRNSAYSSAAAWIFESTVGWAADPKSGETVLGETTYKPNPDGTIPESARWKNVSGINEPLTIGADGKPEFWANVTKQGGFLGNIVNAISGGRAVSQLHDTWWNPVNNAPGTMFGFGFNPVTNVATMLPAAGVTYGALLNSVPYVDHAMIYSGGR